jgi:hypothetical protein
VRAGLDAGLTRREIREARLVASLPEETFQAMVEAPVPATITELVREGKRRRGLATSAKRPHPVNVYLSDSELADLGRLAHARGTSPAETFARCYSRRPRSRRAGRGHDEPRHDLGDSLDRAAPAASGPPLIP